MFGFDIINILNTYGYLGMFIISFLESGVFFLLPGDSLLFTSGVVASQGYLNLYLTIFIFFIGSILGSLTGYEIGKRLEYLQTHKYFKKVFKDTYIKEAHEMIKESGDKLALFSRFIPLARTFMPIVAGFTEMNYKKFVMYNILGSFLWSLTLVGGGYILGNKIPGVENYLSLIILAILIVTISPSVYKIAKRFKKKI